jgi:deazaflavin-dependent oxidoreductase (nitroreductase family)
MTADPPYLYLTTTGHKSGRPHEIEIWFVSHDGRYYLMSEGRDRSHWVQNIHHDPGITFRIGDDPAAIPGRARIFDPEDEPDLAVQISALMDAKYGWSGGLIVEIMPSGE